MPRARGDADRIVAAAEGYRDQTAIGWNALAVALSSAAGPTVGALVLSAAARAPMLATTIVAGLPQEHERALGGWQAEWPTIAALVEALGSAVEAMAEVAGGLTIAPDALQANMCAAEAAVLAERATFLLARKIGKQKAGALVERALAQGGSFVEALGQFDKELADEAALLGYSPKFVDRLLADLKRKR